jgi:hypothetical protein
MCFTVNVKLKHLNYLLQLRPTPDRREYVPTESHSSIDLMHVIYNFYIGAPH